MLGHLFADAGFAHASSYKGSPAAPYFKPSRPYATSHRSGGKPQRQASASSGESLIHNDVSTLGPAPSGSPTRGLMSPSRKRDSQPSPTDSMSSGKSKRDRSLQSSRHNSFSSPDRKGGPLKASLAMQVCWAGTCKCAKTKTRAHLNTRVYVFACTCSRTLTGRQAQDMQMRMSMTPRTHMWCSTLARPVWCSLSALCRLHVCKLVDRADIMHEKVH